MRLAVLTLFSLSWQLLTANPAHASCVTIPNNTPEAAVTACEQGQTYSFEIDGTYRSYAKSIFQQRLRQTIQQWLSLQDLDASLLAGTSLEFFLAVPEINPAATQARVQVTMLDQRALIFYLSLDPETWRLEDIDVGILSWGKRYPEFFGERIASLLIAKQPQADDAPFRRSMAESGVTNLDAIGGGWWSGHVRPLSEHMVVEQLRQSSHVKHVTTDSIIEWIAYRERIFAFSWDPS